MARESLDDLIEAVRRQLRASEELLNETDKVRRESERTRFQAARLREKLRAGADQEPPAATPDEEPEA